MAVMIYDRLLRTGPAGPFQSVAVKQGTQVEIVQKDTGSQHTEIRFSRDGQVYQGWVASEFVDEAADTIDTINKAGFATNCILCAADFDVPPHYVMSVAQFRSGINDGFDQHGIGYGPFLLSEMAWNTFRNIPDLGLDYAEHDRKNWRAQCMVFSAMTSIMREKMVNTMAREPTLEEMVFAQMAGHAAAVRLLNARTQPITSILNSVPADEYVEDGINGPALLTRYKELLADKNGSEILSDISTRFDEALSITKPFIEAEGAAIIANVREALAAASNASINFDSSVIPSSPGRRNNAMLIARKFSDAGYGTIQQLAAIANAIAESGLDAAAKSPAPEESYGLFQLNKGGGVGAGHSVEDLKKAEYNIDVMIKHIKSLVGADRDFSTTSSLKTAVAIFVEEFERPANAQSKIEPRWQIAKKLRAQV